MSFQSPRIYADFHNADAHGRVRLNCIGTVEDLSRQKIELREGLHLTLYADDLNTLGQLDELLVEGIVTFSAEEHCWVATIDWSAVRHASQGHPTTINVLGLAPAAPPVGQDLPKSTK